MSNSTGVSAADWGGKGNAAAVAGADIVSGLEGFVGAGVSSGGVNAGGQAATRSQSRLLSDWAFLVPGVLFHLVFIASASGKIAGQWFFTLFDDAMISLTYGRTLARTGEWVWFEGAERVQGITNPLWSLYMALLHWLGLEGSLAALVVSLTGVVVLAVTALMAGHVARWMLRGSSSVAWLPKAVIVVVSFAYPLVFWTLRGMEVGVLAMSGVLMAWSMCRLADGERSAIGHMALWSMLGVFTRIDFALTAAAFVFWSWVMLLQRGQRGWGWQLTLLLPLPLCAAAVLLFQAAYWGDPLPNTYYLKIVGYSLAERLGEGVVAVAKSVPLLLLMSSGAWWLWARVPQQARPVLAALVSASTIMMVYSVWTGGDAWENNRLLNRYVSSVLPLSMLLIVAGWGSLWSTHTAGLSRVESVPGFIVLAGLAVLIGFAPLRYVGARDAALVALLTLGFLRLGFYATGQQGRPARTRNVVLAAVLLAWAPVSLLNVFYWGRQVADGTFARSDLSVTEKSLAISSILPQWGTVATVWAGAPGYYAQRSMIDLLGKSDKRIARVPPKGLFWPGHNKWDYDISIGEDKPDMILAIWKSRASDYRKLREWGYSLQCHEVLGKAFYLAGSERVNWALVHPCAKAE